jgi:hypothetical protein
VTAPPSTSPGPPPGEPGTIERSTGKMRRIIDERRDFASCPNGPECPRDRIAPSSPTASHELGRAC